MTLDAPHAIAALAARPLHAEALPSRLSISTDTRTLRTGDTFLALRGERFDGHRFVAGAFTKGAAACIVADAAAVPGDAPALVVEDTTRAYLVLARLARERTRGDVVAISGSTGKTTTKAFLVQLLRGSGIPAVATPENENNEIGVSKFLLSLDDGDDRVAIVEMGARAFGDLDALVDAARPGVGILTNIGEAHLEIFGSAERLADTKWGLFARGARAVLNLADAVSWRRAPALPAPPLWFGTGSAAPPPGAPAVVVRDAQTLVVHDGLACSEYPIEVRFPGAYNRANLAAALAGAVALGHAPATLAGSVSALRLPPGRYEAYALDGDARLIFDAYNASLSGTLATLDAFASEIAPRRIAVLGGMAELGRDSAGMHERIGSAAAARADVVLCGGDHRADTMRGAGTKAVSYADNAAAIGWLRATLQPGDVVLLKGSRKYAMEEIARALGAEVRA
jgi:UDP-N-acetylmuramoyl-tripeptide--D-alanyl-D-alanine ligase